MFMPLCTYIVRYALRLLCLLFLALQTIYYTTAARWCEDQSEVGNHISNEQLEVPSPTL